MRERTQSGLNRLPRNRRMGRRAPVGHWAGPLGIEALEARTLLAIDASLVVDLDTYNGSDPSHFVDVAGKLYFVAKSDAYGEELWTSDGTCSGTSLVKDILFGSEGSRPRNLTHVGSGLAFTADDGVFNSLWISDGTSSGTQVLASMPAYQLAAVNDILYFDGDDGVSGSELWRSDGTPLGTYLVREIVPGRESALINQMVNVSGTLFFTSDDREHGRELWKSDGTRLGTKLVADITPGPDDSSFRDFYAIGQQLFFTVEEASTGRELWVSDGSSLGTHLVRDITQGSISTTISAVVEFQGRAYFIADDGEHGSQLWTSDGTSEQTHRITGFGSSSLSVSMYSGLAQLGDWLYFAGYDSNTGTELWKSDGSAEGTALVKDVQPGIQGSVPYWITSAGQRLLFSTNNETRLWVSDGSDEGTQEVVLADVDGTAPFDFRDFISVGGELFLTAAGATIGRELFKVDDSPPTLNLVRDLRSWSFGRNPYGLTNLAGTLFFAAYPYLWTSDGSESGTTPVARILGAGTNVSDFTNVNGKLYLSGIDTLAKNLCSGVLMERRPARRLSTRSGR